MSCIAARAGQPEKALNMLQTYLRANTSRNGFHLNGDYKNLGTSVMKYRPFTLEGNFAAGQAVHEMLLQGWGDRLRIFPAVPSAWKDAAFENLRAEGALRVSARRRRGRTVSVRIAAEAGGTLRLADPFDGRKPKWSLRGVRRDGKDYRVTMKPGQVLSASAE